MTIAISLKVNDGVVLAADSASTLIAKLPAGGTTVVNVYNHANKVFNLIKGLPIGAITWGSGSIGTASVSTVVKDLRRRLSGGDPEHADWAADRGRYSIERIAEQLKQYIFEELYETAFQSWPEKPPLGFIVAGYSANEGMAEEYKIEMTPSGLKGPESLRKKEASGMTWGGEPEAVNRLVLGYDSRISQILQNNLGMPAAQVPMAIEVIQQGLMNLTPMIFPAMPIQDAIDLAEFLVDVSTKFSRFIPGAPTVGGPIEVAAITKHEGYKWIRRKYYFQRELNPEVLSK